MHRLRWDDLNFVRAVAEHGSLSAAARALGVNHATVLRRITALEDDFGVSLFDRPPGGYRLRPEGRDMLAAIQSIGRTVDRLERSLNTLGKGIEGTVRLTTTDSVADALLPRHLAALAGVHPRLRIELTIANRPIDLSRPEAEVTLRPAQTLPEGLAGRRAPDMLFQVFGSVHYLARNPSPNPEDHRWLGVAPPLTRSPVNAWQEDRLGDAVVMRADSFVTLARLARAGLGLAMMPAFLGRSTPELAQAPAFPDETRTCFWVASHRDLYDYPQVRGLIDFFAEALASDARLLT